MLKDDPSNFTCASLSLQVVTVKYLDGHIGHIRQPVVAPCHVPRLPLQAFAGASRSDNTRTRLRGGHLPLPPPPTLCRTKPS
jgi:hypothetical protein